MSQTNKSHLTNGLKFVIYPGTFDPITYGHLDLISRATKLFDKVVVAIAGSKNKKPLFSIEERIKITQRVLSSAELENKTVICSFDGLLVNFMRKNKIGFILRGMRVVSDFEREFQLAHGNRVLDGDIETIFMMPGEKHAYTSSSLVKEIASMRGKVDKFVPPLVQQALQNKLTKC